MDDTGSGGAFSGLGNDPLVAEVEPSIQDIPPRITESPPLAVKEMVQQYEDFDRRAGVVYLSEGEQEDYRVFGGPIELCHHETLAPPMTLTVR